MITNNNSVQGIIFDIKRFAIHDGPGLRTTVFFKGCPLNCWWCHNPESISPKIESYTLINKLDNAEFSIQKNVGSTINLAELIKEIQKEEVFMKEGKGGVTLSGGEPLAQPQFAQAVLKRCKELGIHTTVDTSGAVSDAVIKSIFPYTDLFLYDIKMINADLHKKYTGMSNKLILENFISIIEAGKQIIARIPIIPGINTDNEELKRLLELFAQFKADNFNEINLLPYHQIGNSKYKRFNKNNRMIDVKVPSIHEMQKIKKYFTDARFNVKLHA